MPGLGCLICVRRRGARLPLSCCSLRRGGVGARCGFLVFGGRFSGHKKGRRYVIQKLNSVRLRRPCRCAAGTASQSFDRACQAACCFKTHHVDGRHRPTLPEVFVPASAAAMVLHQEPQKRQTTTLPQKYNIGAQARCMADGAEG